MKNLCDPAIAKYRDDEADEIFGTKDQERHLGGAFMIPVASRQGMTRRVANMRVLASSGADQREKEFRWDHVSVSHSDRCPTWDEMDFVKRLFFKPEEVCFQLHVSSGEHINNHPHCLHIWRPLEREIPLPPGIMVGIPGVGPPGELPIDGDEAMTTPAKSQEQLRREAEARLVEADQIAALIAAYRAKWRKP